MRVQVNSSIRELDRIWNVNDVRKEERRGKEGIFRKEKNERCEEWGEKERRGEGDNCVRKERKLNVRCGGGKDGNLMRGVRRGRIGTECEGRGEDRRERYSG